MGQSHIIGTSAKQSKAYLNNVRLPFNPHITMYIARNSNGCLWLFAKKPKRIATKTGGYWTSSGEKMPICNNTPYPRWSDEPLPVRLQADWIAETAR